MCFQIFTICKDKAINQKEKEKSTRVEEKKRRSEEGKKLKKSKSWFEMNMN
jgi:hypothetical protein